MFGILNLLRAVLKSEAGLIAKEAILKLVAEGCDPVEFTFRADKTVIYKDGMKYLEVANGETGETVDCAPTYDVIEGTFDFNATELSLNYEQKAIFRGATVGWRFLNRLGNRP